MNFSRLIITAEKSHYPFKSYPTQPCETLLFPGCSFPSQFPHTMDALSQLCREAGIGIAYDCCGDPLNGLDNKKPVKRVVSKLRTRLAKLGVKRLVLVCPNCQKHLQDEVDCELVSIFDVFKELGVDCAGRFGEGKLFTPCPDKKTHVLEDKMRGLYEMDCVQTMEGVACCGLRPDLFKKGPEYVQKLSGLAIERAEGQPIYSYCASCLGQFSRMGHQDSYHVVSVILGVDESPDSANAIKNRARRKFDKNTNPLPGATTMSTRPKDMA